jgi:hypothetical protein
MGRELLIPEKDIWVETAGPEHSQAVAALYKSAYERSDYFAELYDNPNAKIFNADWLKAEFQNPDHNWFVFTDNEANVLGSTGFFHDYDQGGSPVMVSDKTQISPNGRGMRIMDHFFKRVVPLLESSGAQLATGFVLTPESKGLRRTLQSDLGMISLGIHPHILKHRKSGISRSEISSAKYQALEPGAVTILPDFEQLYSIVKSQTSNLPDPEIISTETAKRQARYSNEYVETDRPIGGTNPREQRAALEAGFQPVAYDPQLNQFKMAQFPQTKPELDFIINSEAVEPNKKLVEYLYGYLYQPYGEARLTKGRNDE